MNHVTDYKEKTKAVYNLYPEAFDEKLVSNFQLLNIDKAERFIKHLPGQRILDIGAGAGVHAAYFQEHGYDVLCGDNSEAMVALCRRKGLRTELMDIEAFEMPPQSFDGIWAYAVLLHLPKAKIPPVIEQLAQLLAVGGILAVSLKEGEGEGFTEDKRYPEGQRFFSFFSDEEARSLFEPHFSLLYATKTPATQTVPFLHYLFQKA